MFNGKALYKPQGRSGEYSQWAINFYNGCAGGCAYCYNKRFPLLSAPKPTLKACFKNNEDAVETAIREVQSNKNNIIKDGGVFLSFVSDPCLPETFDLTLKLLVHCSPAIQEKYEDKRAIPISILTKQASWIVDPNSPEWDKFCSFDYRFGPLSRENITFGFTLTGHDELEPGCSSSNDRIAAMDVLHEEGYHTWASIEPIIDFDSSLEMIRLAAPFCNHFKVGLRTDKKFECSEDELVSFINGVREVVNRTGSTVYFKRSIRDLVGGGYIIGTNFVEEGFNIFTQDRPDFNKIFK